MKFLTMLRNAMHVRTLDDPSSFPVCLCWAECSKDLSRSINYPYSSRRCLMGPYHFGGCESFPQVLLPDKFAAVFES